MSDTCHRAFDAPRRSVEICLNPLSKESRDREAREAMVINRRIAANMVQTPAATHRREQARMHESLMSRAG